jgi:hypothetical protein
VRFGDEKCVFGDAKSKGRDEKPSALNVKSKVGMKKEKMPM